MITYEEFIKKNNINELHILSFEKEETMLEDALIQDDPREYIDVAQRAKELGLIKVDPIQNAEYYEYLTEFIGNCNEDVKISNGLIGIASKTEYLKSEEIIKEVLTEVNPEWTTKQKLAYVHYKMGELISYIPDFNFAGKYIGSPMVNNSRNIWKSIVDEKSVCNGVTYIERNILSRMGIKTRELSSGTHSFLLTETEEGNIITDATWDLSNTLYKARPQYYGITYENLRKQEEGISNAHKLKNPPENVIEISDEELREIYHSIGLTKEDRTFPFPVLDKVQEINSKKFISTEEKLKTFLNMFKKDFSKESTHLSETRDIIEMCIEELGIPKNNLKTRFVYQKEDEDLEKPYLIFHIDTEDLRDKIRFFDIDEMSFKDINLKEFDEKYKLHDLDTTEPFWKTYIQEQNIEHDMQNEEENCK